MDDQGHGGHAHSRPERVLPPGTVAYFRERLYATFTGLAIVRVVHHGEHSDPRHAFLALLLGVVGIVIAGTVSEWIAHLLVHHTVLDRDENRTLLRAALGALSTALLPLLLIGASWLGWMSTGIALQISAWIYILTLAGVGWLALRRARLIAWQKVIVLAVLVGMGVLVIIVQQLAKSV